MEQIDLGICMMPASDVDAVKAFLKSRVETVAEHQRLRYITGGTTKAMEYLEARDQALAVKSMGESMANSLPDHGAADFPVLAASVPVEAPTLWAAHALVLGRYEAYATLTGRIKSVTIAAKKSISDASDSASAKAAYEGITWPTP